MLGMEKHKLFDTAEKYGIIIAEDVQEQVFAMQRKELLSKHPYKIWQGKDGKWRSYLPDEKKGRRLINRSSQKDVENEIIKYWKTQEENPKIKEVFQEWNDRRLELKKISEATHLRNKQIFNRHYKEFGEERIKSIEPEEIEEL